MLEASGAGNTSASVDKPIELDYAGNIVSAVMSSTNRPKNADWLLSGPPEARYRERLSVFSMLDYLDCPSLIDEHRFGLASAAGQIGRAFDLLVMACDRNDRELGSLAIMQVERAELTNLCQSIDTLNGHLARLRPDWADHVRHKVLVTIDGEVLFRRLHHKLGTWFGVNFAFPCLHSPPPVKRKRASSPVSSSSPNAVFKFPKSG